MWINNNNSDCSFLEKQTKDENGQTPVRVFG